MRIFFGYPILTALVLLTSVASAANPAFTPESLADELVKAIRSKSPELRRALLHEKSRACINSQTQPYFDWIFTRQFRYAIPEEYKVSTQPLSKPAGSSLDKSAYPVAPTHQVQIDFHTTPYRSTSIVVMASKDGGNWREILPCPSPEAVAGAQRSVAETDRQNRRINMLAAQVAEPLRSEIIAMARAGRRIDAIRRYAEATGEDLVIARGVVEHLLQEK